ncbi:putative germin-like protein 2-1 [Cinnamomum micranthum f. kanehirae]|uniref:Putative germin-like protein 2-1 n=1 Tax=Cinnamomum micranthum f. kanehirae TaxID=337451 RepID=A0A3S3NL36_9MAGN|nr:putative germin-like protein 2-1 [Cinnamomum micranthum f. kanehirae]
MATAVFVNGCVCKDPKLAKADDFFFEGLDKPGNTSNNVGSAVTAVFVDQMAGLNTLGISLVRIDYASYGETSPHTHPRATEILTVLERTLYVGFVLSNQNNSTLINKVLNKANIGHIPVVAIAAFNGQNLGIIAIANSVFGSNPPISDKVLAKAFQVDKKVIDYLEAQFWVNP